MCRMFAAACLLIFQCVAGVHAAIVLGVAPNSGSPGQTITSEVKGVGFPAPVTSSQVSFGAGISVSSVASLPSQTMVINGETVIVNAIRVVAVIDSSATAGARRVAVGPVSGLSLAVFQVTASSGNGGSPGPNLSSRNYPAGADAPEGLVAVDHPRDGLMDLVVAPDGDSSLSFFKSLRAQFAPARKIRGPVFGSAMIAAADVNRDGRVDLITASRSAASVCIWIATPAGWKRPVQVAIPAPAWAVATGDFNGDAAQDIVAAVRDFNQLALLAGNGNGTFRAPVLRSVGDTPKSLAVADFNKDGLADAIAGNFAQSISILLGNRTAGLSTQRRKNAPVNMENMIATDFNNDGNPDLATIGGDSILIYRGKGNGDFFAPRRIRLADFMWDLAAADFNLDGTMDLAFVNFAADQVSIMLGKGNLQFASPFSFQTQDLPTRIIAADFDGDRKPDIALTNYGSDTISVYGNRTVIED